MQCLVAQMLQYKNEKLKNKLFIEIGLRERFRRQEKVRNSQLKSRELFFKQFIQIFDLK